MYFNRKNAEQKNWRMIKKGKHFLFGCSLVFAVGAALVAPTVKADTADTGEVETKTANSAAEASSSDEVGTYKAPAVGVSTTSPVVAENPTSSEATSAKTAKEADGVQLPSLTVVADSSALTDEEKANVVEAVKGVNPTATDVQVQADGSVVVTFADGSSANLSASQTVKVAAPAETSATQPKSRSRRAAGQERAQDRSMEGKDIKFEYKGGKKIEDGDPTQRAKIEYKQLDDYEVVNGKTVPTDPSGQGRPVLEWTVTFNEAKWDRPGAFWYFSIPKNVSDPYNVVTEYDGDTYATRTEWNNGDGNANAEGKQFIDDGSKLEDRVKLTTGAGEYDKVPGLNGVMANSKKLYVLQTNIYSGVRKFTVRYRTVVEDPSKTISYIAGVQAAKNLKMHNWYAISGKYDKELVSAVATPNVTPNLTNTSVNVPVQTVASTSNTLSGTGTPGATIKLYIDGQEQNIGNVTVDSSGNWTTGELPTALNNNQGDGTTIKPRQIVQVSQTVNGTESSRRTVPVSVGVTTVEPSSLTTNQDAVVAGQKEVTLKVPHDAGIAYMRYTNTAGETVEIPVKRDNASSAWTSQKSDKATVKSVENGKFQDTIVLTMADKIAGTEVSAISNVVEGGFSSVAGWQPRSVENQAPTIASAVEGNKKTVAQGAQLDLASLVTVADKEDDAQATLGDKVHAEVVSVNGDTATKTVDTNTPGTYTVKYKAVDSQGKKSDEIEVTVVVNPARQNEAPTVEIPYSNKDTKEVYVYSGEENSFDIKFKDDSGKIASATVKQGGNRAFDDVAGEENTINTQYGFKANVINAETTATDATPAVITYRGTPAATDGLSQSDFDAATKGDKAPGMVLGWRYATATDTDGAFIENKAVGNPTDPGAFRVILKTQAQKYDIATPTEKVTVADPANVTNAELGKIKEKLQLEYSQNNDDANLADKKGKTVADKDAKIQSVAKDAEGNLVVTYADGSQEKRALSDFVNVAPKVEIPYSLDNRKDVFVYANEDFDIPIKFTDDSGKIASAEILRGGNKVQPAKDESNPNILDNEYDTVVEKISTETTATAADPAVVHIRGKITKDTEGGTPVKKLTLPTTESAELPIVTRYATATDTDGGLLYNISTGNSYANDPGSFRIVLKAQTAKYDIKDPETKISVANANNISEDVFNQIKDSIKIQYSTTNKDKNLLDKQGTDVDNQNERIESITREGNNVVVTYKDGSKDTKALADFVNVAPTVELPYSNKDKKEIYVYTGENTDLTFKASDNTAVKDMYVRGPGGIGTDNTAGYGFTTGKIENSAVTHGDGTVSGATATLKMTGVTTLKAPNHWTSFVVANDNDNAPSATDFRALDQNPNATQTPGYVHFIVKSQTDKYDIATPADKVEVADPNNVTNDDLAKIKEKLQLEYKKDNDDANIKKDTAVDKNGKIQSVTKDGNNLVVTYTDGSTDKKPLSEFVTKAKPSKPVVETDLTGKAGTKTPVVVSAEPGTKVELFDKDGKKIGEGTADTNGKVTITPTVDIPAGNVTAKATDPSGKVSDPSDAATATTPSTPAKPSKPVVETDLTGKAGTKTPVVVSAEPGTKVELFDKDGKKIGEGTADTNGKVTITPTVDIPAGNVTAKATDPSGKVSDPSDAATATTPSTPAKPSKPVVETDLTGKAGTKTPVVVSAEPGTKVELFDKDGKKIGEGTADTNGKVTITPTVDIPAGNVTAKATDPSGKVSDPSDAATATTPSTPAKPSKPVVETDLTGKAGTKTPVVVSAEPGTKVELFDKDGKKIGEGTADTNGKVTITPTVDIPAGNVTAKATDPSGKVSDPSDAATATTPSTPAKPSKPVVETDLTGKAGTKTPVVVSAEPGTKVELFDKDGKKIGEGTADTNGKVTITPTVDIPAGNVTAKATDPSGKVSDPSDAATATTPSTPAKPSKPVVETDLTGKAGTKTPVVVSAEPGTKVELFDKDGKKIGEGTADNNGKVTITPTVDIPAGNVTAKATKDGQTSDASKPKEATPSTPAKPSKPVVETDLTGKAGTKTPVVVSAEPGTKVELFDKDGKKIGEGTADNNGKVTITPTVDIPAGNVTAKATKDGQTSDASKPKEATPSTPAKPSKPVVETDLTGKAGTKTPVVVSAEPGTKVELFDKDGKKIGEGTADTNGKVTITPTVDIPAGNVTAKATDPSGKVSDPSDAATATTPSTPAKPSKPVVETDLTGKAGTKTPVVVSAEPGTKVELFDKDGKKIGEGTADTNGKVTITPTVDIPAGNVTAKATDPSGKVSDPSDAATATTPSTPAKPSKPVVETDLTGKAGTKTPVVVSAEPGTKVELFDKDGKKIGEGTADTNGKVTITPTVDIPAGNVTAKATDPSGKVSDPSDAATATTPSTPAKPSKPVVETDLTGKAGTKTPVVVSAEPGTKVELFDKDGKKIGEGTADTNGKVTITPTVDIPAGNVTAKATDPSGKVSDPSDAATATTPSTPAKPSKPVVETDLTGKAGTKTPVVVSAEPGTKVELFDKDGKKIGEGTADTNGKVTITPTVDIPAGNVTAKATDPSGKVSDPSDAATATTPSTPAKPSKPVVETDLTGKAGTKTPVVVSAEPGTKVELFDKDGKKIGEGTADNNGKVTITPTVDIPAGNVTAKATKDGQTSDASKPKEATPSTPAKPSKPVVETDLTGKAGTKTPVVVSAEPGTKVELFDKDGKKIGEGTADNNGKVTITPTVDIPAGNVTAKATKDGQTSDASKPKEATAPTPTTPTQPEITTDLTGKAGTKTPVEVTAEPGTKVELFDKDGNKIGEDTADNNGKAKITPTVDIPAGNVTAKATKDGQTSDASKPKEATAPTPTTPTQPEITTDLTGKAGTKTPVEVTAEPGTKVELFDKDGNKIGEDTADNNGKAKITPTVDIPAGNVTAKATKDGQTSDASKPKEATAPTPTTPTQPEITTDLTGKAGTKTPVEVTAEPGTKVELFDKDGNKIGEDTADNNGKAKITPTVDIPAGNVTAKATKDGQTSDASKPKEATAPTPTTPTQPEITTDLTGKAGTKTPVEVTAEPGTKVELFDKDGNKIGEDTADNNGKAKITPTVDIPAGNVTAKATKDGQTSDASAPKEATAATPAKPSKPVVATDLTGKAGTKTPVEVTAEPGSHVELFDKDGNKIGEGTADTNGKVTITPTVDIPAGNVTAKVTKDGQTSDASAPKEATAATPAKPSKPVVATDLTGKAGTKTPVEVTAEPGSHVELFDKDGKKIGEGTADTTGKVTITPTVDIPAGNVTAKATDPSGKVSDPSDAATATTPSTPSTPAKPSKPVVETDLTGKAGTKTPVEVTAEPGSHVELFDKDGKKIGEGTADTTGKVTITPTVDIPAGNVTAKATDPSGKVSDPSDVAKATTPAKDADGVKDPAKTPVKDPANLTDEEKAKVADEVKKANPTAKDVEVGKDGTATVTFPDGSKAEIPTAKTVKKSADKAVKDPSVTPVTDPSNLTDAEKAKVADEVKKSNPTAKDVEVGKDGTTTVTYPDGTTAVIPADKTVKKSADKAVKDPSVTPVTDPSNLTDAEKAKVADEVKKSNPTAKDVEVGKDGTTTVTYPDGTTAVIPADKTVKKSADKAVKDPSVTPVTDPSNLTDAEKAKVADEVKKSNPTAKDVEVGKDGTTTVTYPDGTTAVIPADKTVKKSADKAVKDPSVTPVTDPSNLTDAEKAKVAEEVKKSNPTVTDVKVDKDGTTTVTYPDGTTAVVPADKTVKKSADKAVKDPSVTPVTDPSNLTDAEKAKVSDEVKKSNPTVTDVKVDKDGTTTVTYPDGTTAVIPANKTVKRSVDKAVKDPAVTPVTNPSNLTDAEKAKVADEVKKSNPTVTDVKVDKDGTTTVTYPDGTTAVVPADKTVKKSADKAVKDPSVTPVTDPSNLTDAEKAKVSDEVKKSNPTVTDVKVDKDGTTTVTYPDGTTAVIPADKTVKKSDDKGTKDPSVTPVTDPSNLTDAEKAKVSDEVKKSNPTVTDVKVDKDGTTTVTYPDGTTAVIPADKTVKKSDDKVVTDPSVTPVTDPSNLTDAEKAKVADEVKKSNPTVSKVEVGNDGTTTVTYPDGTTAVIPADKTVKKSDDKVVTDPSVTPVTDPSNLTDAEKAKVADEVKKSNPTAKDVEVGKDGTTTVTYPDGTTAVIPADKTVKKSDDKAVKDPSVTPVTDPSNLTDAEKAKVADEVKKSNPTAKDVEVGKDGTTTVTYPDGTTAVIPADKTVKKSDDKVLKDSTVTPVTEPSNLTDAEKAKVADEVKKANPTVTDVKVGKDGTTTVTYPDGTTAVIPADKTVKKSADKAVKDPSVTPVTDPNNLTDAEKAKVADEVKKSNPTVSKVEVGKDGTTTVTYPDGTTAVIPADKTVKKSADKAVKDPSVTPVTDPSNLTDAEKAKVADEVKKSNPTVTDVKVGKDGTTTVTYPDGTTAVIPADKTVKKSADKVVTNPSVTPVTDPSNLTDTEKAKVADEVKKANPTAKDIKVNKDGSVVVTFEDGTTAVIPADKTVKKSSDKVKESDGVKNPSVTPVTDPSNLTDVEKAKVADEVKKANPTAKDIKVNNDGSVVVTFEDGSVAVIPAEKAVTAANQDSPAQAPAKKAGAKELPNTGTEQSSASLALALLAAATGGLLFAKKREEEE